jgi:hemolysin III
MGLAIVIAIKPSIEIASATNSMGVLIWFLIGGVFYIIGAVIYALSKREFSHAVFHVFVLLGLISHIYASYLIPLF